MIDVEHRAGCDVADFWEPMHSRKERNLILDPDEFYILASKEDARMLPLKLCLPTSAPSLPAGPE